MKDFYFTKKKRVVLKTNNEHSCTLHLSNSVDLRNREVRRRQRTKNRRKELLCIATWAGHGCLFEKRLRVRVAFFPKTQQHRLPLFIHVCKTCFISTCKPHPRMPEVSHRDGQAVQSYSVLCEDHSNRRLRLRQVQVSTGYSRRYSRRNNTSPPSRGEIEHVRR